MAATNYVGMQLNDRPEFANKPKPLTFLRDRHRQNGRRCDERKEFRVGDHY